jgi:hypothetical protein
MGTGEFSFLKFAGKREAQRAAVGQVLDGVWSGMNVADACA